MRFAVARSRARRFSATVLATIKQTSSVRRFFTQSHGFGVVGLTI
jgi:hypothetical protein